MPAKEATVSSSSPTGSSKKVGSRQKRSRSDAANNNKPMPMQYYVPPGPLEHAQALLEHDDGLTEQDVLDFCRHGGTATKSRELQEEALVNAYHERRREMRDLAWKKWQGEAFVDDFGRLVPVSAAAENNEELRFPPPLGPPPPAAGHRNGINGHDDNNDNGNAAVPNNNNNNPNVNPNQMHNNMNINNLPFPLDAQEEERRWTEQEEREAAEAIARALRRYQQEGVSPEDYVLIRVKPTERPERASLTFRRICFAVLAVVTAFLCIMLQTLPLFPRDSQPDPLFDKLLYELLHVRPFQEHVQACPGLTRAPPTPPSSWTDRVLRFFWRGLSSPLSSSSIVHPVVDCSDGVLHIPSKTVLVDSYFDESSTSDEAALWEPYVLGVNVSWFMPCNFPPVDNNNATTPPISCQQEPEGETGQSEGSSSCDAQQQQPMDTKGNNDARCFRGIHDNMISDQEVGETLRLGSQLIHEGWDHFDIHYDKTLLLQEKLPTLLQTIRGLLQEAYLVRGGSMQPVAFRVSAVGPLDGSGALQGSHTQNSNYLLRILNRKRYTRWIEKKRRHNELARYSLPWPTARLKPFRDPCHLMSDLEADPRFEILTTVFLSNGAGREFRGGVSLYVDDHPSNANPRKKLERGCTIDGSRGRLVVSTGGYENLRCRLPTRDGVRAALQIWWSCDSESDDASCVS